jgi:hypothetical protein
MDAQTRVETSSIVKEMRVARKRDWGFWLNASGNVVVVVSLTIGVLLLI